MAHQNTEDIKDDDIWLYLVQKKEEGVVLLLRKYGPYWMAYLKKKYSSGLQEADFEEIISKACFKIFKNIESYDRERSFKNWVNRIVCNLAVDYLRAAKKRDREIPLDNKIISALILKKSSPEDQQEGLSSRGERTKFLEIFERELSEDQREVLKVFADQEGITAKEVGEYLGMSESHVRVIKKRAIDKIKSKLAGNI